MAPPKVKAHDIPTPRTRSADVKSQPAKPMADPEAGEHGHKHFLQLAFIVLACMVGMVMFLWAVTVLIRYLYARRYSRNRNRNRNQSRRDTEDSPTLDNDDDVVIHPIWYIRTEGLQQSLIDSITVFKYRKQEGIIHGTECSVCLGEFEDEDSLRLLPKCSHAFHIPCIDTWLTSHQNCPFCRAPVTTPAVDHNNHTVSDHQTHRTDHQIDEVRGVSSNSSPLQVDVEKRPLRRSASVGSSSAALVDLDAHTLTHYYVEKVNTSTKDMTHISIEKHGGGIGCSTSTTMPVHKLASIGRALQKKPVSMRRSFSQNTHFLFSRHARSQSSTLPL